MGALQKIFGKHGDVALVALVLGVLVVLFVPIPSWLLDFLLLANFSLAFLLLLLTFYMARPVEFSTFPSMLLIATLLRLALNVAATRLILSHGEAGRVINAVGTYVVGGNYVIGLIVFVILIVVQYVVITNGAQRVSEVAARFTLDSMPGQQMSIDADLNMGLIDQAEAQARRKKVEQEANFYGAMDGASKFVKGDAIAGILILLTNIIGGLVIGVMQAGMPWREALQTYTLLTVGDGIVTQVPALVIALGTGIIVTRSASDGMLGAEALKQITSFPKIMLVVAGALGLLLLLPGIPAWPALALIVLLLVGAKLAHTLRPSQAEEADKKEIDDPYKALEVEPIEVFIGQGWTTLLGGESSPFMERVAHFRSNHAAETGLVLPAVKFKEASRLSRDAYEIYIDGVLAARGEGRADRLLAIHPTGDVKAVPGELTKDPTYGLPALWIETEQRAAALEARYTVVDAETLFMTHLTEVLRREAANLLTRMEVERLLTRVRTRQPTLIEELIPTVLSVSDVQRILQNLLREKVSIRHIDAILETLADAARQVKDVDQLTETVRGRLGPAICRSLVGEGSALQVITLDPAIEAELMHSIRSSDGASLVIAPDLADRVIRKLLANSERMMRAELLPVLLCAPQLRRHVRSLTERVVPHLRVLAMTEVPPAIELKSFAVVSP
ncbi:MAG: hypothetical protein RIR70_685 [Pseudomonadota bacterium]